MEYQHYIGEGPEAQAILNECLARKQAKHDAVIAFAKRHGFSNAWQRGHSVLGGLASDKKLSDEEAKALGLKYFKCIEEGCYAYEPHRGTSAGKKLKQEIEEINNDQFDVSDYIIKATGMAHTVFGPHAESRSGQCIAHSTAGHACDKLVVKVPIGKSMHGDNPSPTPPPWLREAKESEVLALYGK